MHRCVPSQRRVPYHRFPTRDGIQAKVHAREKIPTHTEVALYNLSCVCATRSRAHASTCISTYMYTGQGIANPTSQILTGAMMLAHLGEHAASDQLQAAVGGAFIDGVIPVDLGGTANTKEMVDAVLKHM